MEWITQFVIENAENAHIVIFSLLILAGFSVPISEDVLIIVGGMLASTVVPHLTTKIFVWTFLGCYLSDWIAYWLGRVMGPQVWKKKKDGGKRLRQQLLHIARFYRRYGFFTLLVGRFIPFGVRNLLFITAGVGGMSFVKFIISDGIACFLSNSTLFYLSYSFGQNYLLLLEKVKVYNYIVIGIVVTVGVTALLVFRLKKWMQE